MQLLLLLLKNDEKQAAEGHQGGCQWEAPPEGFQKSRRALATEDNFGKPVDALDFRPALGTGRCGVSPLRWVRQRRGGSDQGRGLFP